MGFIYQKSDFRLLLACISQFPKLQSYGTTFPSLTSVLDCPSPVPYFSPKRNISVPRKERSLKDKEIPRPCISTWKQSQVGHIILMWDRAVSREHLTWDRAVSYGIGQSHMGQISVTYHSHMGHSSPLWDIAVPCGT